MSALPSPYAQLLGLGLVWVSAHCAGMCGPLLVGLDVAGVRSGRSALRGAGQVLLYQLGRSLTYAWLGALCGLLGAGLSRILRPAGSLLALALGVAALWPLLRPLLQRLQLGGQQARPAPELVRLRRSADEGKSFQLRSVERAQGFLRPLLESTHPLRPLALGAAMGLLPCMLVGWALGLAALSGSALRGALVMLLLCAMTTPMLLTVTALPRLALFRTQGGLRTRLARVLPAVAGVWLLLCGAAGLGLIAHQHIGVTVLGRPLLLMLF
ncbi:MAG: sulfite exporter TauE/SafE family protein [Polyangia bacterium]